MLQQLLARMEEMNANQEKAEASISANIEDMLVEIRARMKSNEDLLARLKARIETNREKDREDLKEMKEQNKSGQAEMRSTICAFRSDLEQTTQQETKDSLSYVEHKHITSAMN
jgi:hypothetical protein